MFVPQINLSFSLK